MFVQAGLTYICSFNAVHLRCFVFDFLLLEKDIRGITLLIMLSCHSWLGPGIYSSALYSALADICAVIKIRSLVLARDDCA